MKFEQIKTPQPRWPHIRSVDPGRTVDQEPVVVIHLSEDGDTTTERLTLSLSEATDLHHGIGEVFKHFGLT